MDERNRTAVWSYRSATVLLLLFAVMHTMGFLRFVPSTAVGKIVHTGMHDVTFPFGGVERSYAMLYDGFGFTVTAYLVFSAVVAWTLGGLSSASARATRGIAWALCAVQAASAVLSFCYFFPAPTVMSAIAAGCCGYGAWEASAQPT